MKPKVYPALERAVEIGANHAWRHAFKHDPDAPEITERQHNQLVKAIVLEVMLAISNDFHINDQYES